LIIPKDAADRQTLYLDLVEKCAVSRAERRADYSSLRSWYLFGAGPDEVPAHYNKIYPHIDQVTSFLFSADTTRFSINLGASSHQVEHGKVPVLTQALNDKWTDSNGDQVFAMAVTWALAFNSAFIKLVMRNGSIHPYMVEPGSIGVLREDTPYTDRQEAFVHWYYITRSDLARRLYGHPKRADIMRRVSATQHQVSSVPEGVDRIVMSQTSPTIYGTVNMDLYGFNRMKAMVAEDTVEMRELYVWNDETNDYQVITIADPDVVIYDREGEQLFLKGELPFVQITPNPQYDYYWGQSEVQKLVYLQQMRNKRMAEILDLLSKQVNPPTALMGFSGILDEKNFALNRAGGLLANDMPQGKVERMAPDMPADLFKELDRIDEMFSEASGISSVMAGRGESGVRSQGHATQLARLGSSRVKKRALVIEDSLEKMATLYLKLMQAYDRTQFQVADGMKFIAEQFTKDYIVKVDAHSNSPIFMEDMRQLAFNLFKAQVIDKESLLDLLDPPMKQLLKERLKKAEAKQAAQPPQPGAKPDLKQVK
jgi:hypothetical protein